MGNQSNEKSFSLLKKISRKNFKAGILRYAITVFSCVMIIVMGAGILAYASATTIGENIITNILTATGLTVSGNATTTGTLNAEGGITGNLTGNVTGDLTGTSTNAEQLGNILAADYSTEIERTAALASYLPLTGGTISGDLTVSGTTALATTSLATTTISALSSINGNIIYVQPGDSIQSVITSITDATSTNPYTIMITPGVYDETLILKEWVNLQGYGRGVSRIEYSEMSWDSPTNAVEIASNIKISFLTFDSSGSFSTNAVGRTDSADKTNIIFSDCDIIGPMRAVYWTGKFTDTKFVDCLLSCSLNAMETACGNADGAMEFFSCAFKARDTINLVSVVWSSGTGAEASHVKLFNCDISSISSNASSGGIVVDATMDIYASSVSMVAGQGVKARASGIVNIYGGSVSGTTDLYQKNTTAQINVYGAKYTTTSGVIGGTQRQQGKAITLAAHGTFGPEDGNVFKLDSNGSYNFNPSGVFAPWTQITIINTDGADTFTFDSAGLNQAVTSGQRGIFVYDGSNWLKIFVGS